MDKFDWAGLAGFIVFISCIALFSLLIWSAILDNRINECAKTTAYITCYETIIGK